MIEQEIQVIGPMERLMEKQSQIEATMGRIATHLIRTTERLEKLEAMAKVTSVQMKPLTPEESAEMLEILRNSPDTMEIVRVETPLEDRVRAISKALATATLNISTLQHQVRAMHRRELCILKMLAKMFPTEFAQAIAAPAPTANNAPGS